MAIAKTLRFIRMEMPTEPLSTYDFPPAGYLFEETKLMLLGISNKTDLMDKADNKQTESVQAIYCDRHGTLYDLVFTRGQAGNQVYVLAIATRPRPD